jgi:hypothetical protein
MMYDPKKYGFEIDELPSWMRPRPSNTDWALVATLILCLVTVWPLLVRDGIPHSPQAELHMYRIHAVSRSIEEGDLYPRWSDNFNYGYGSPLFNHLAPLPHYLGGIHAAFVQSEPFISLKVVIALAVFVGGIGTMAFVRQRSGPLAGVFAVLVFLFSPYILITEPYLRTDIGVLWAVAIFPGVLWAVERVLNHGKGRDVMGLAFASGLLLIADNSLSPLLFALAAGWFIWRCLLVAGKCNWGLAILSFLSGLGLSGFYTIPVLLERDAMRWVPLDTYPYTRDLSNLLAVYPPFDQSLFNPLPTLHLGLGVAILGAAGFGGLMIETSLRLLNHLRRKSTVSPPFTTARLSHLASTFYFGFIALGAFMALNAVEALIWDGQERFEALKPEDLLGVITVCGAILSAQLVELIERYLRHISRRVIGLLMILPVVFYPALNTLYTPDFYQVNVPVTNNDQLELEQRGHALGTIRTGYFLPDDVEELPQPSDLLQQLDDLSRIDKVAREGLSGSARVEIGPHGPISDEFTIENQHEQTLTVLTFYYPGWEAERNDRPTEVYISSPEGFIQVPLPTGRNEIELRFRNTPERQWGWLVSAIALVLGLSLGYGLESRREKTYAEAVLDPRWLRLKRDRHILITGIVLIALAITLTIRLNPSLVTFESPPSTIPSRASSLEFYVEGGIGFLGYDVDNDRVSTDDTLVVDTFWRANQPNLPDFQVSVLLIQIDNSAVVYEQRYRHISTWPSNRWPTSGYIIAQYPIQLPESLAPGQYQVALEVRKCDRIDLQPCKNIAPQPAFGLEQAVNRIVLPPPITIRKP